MKITSLKVLNDGLSPREAETLWEKTEANANYQFNRSHAVEYSIISYWCLWLRVRYPAEYFAACLSIVADDKLPGLVKDAREAGIEVLPPDINLSSDKYVITPAGAILAPFNAVLGISETIAKKIVQLRDGVGGSFASADDFKSAAGQSGTKVNVRAVERLELVGALASVDPTSLPARHPDRRKNQTELMPGLIIDVVKADRYTDMTAGFLKAKVVSLVQEYSKCEGCSLKDSPHPTIRIPKSKVKFMVVTDCPSWPEEKEGKLLTGDAADYLKLAITEAGLSVGEGYYTTLVKARKNDKFLSNEQINGCRGFIERELEIIKPAVIVALGSASIRFLLPDEKGGTAELAGNVVYDAKREASIVCGINPQQIVFDDSKQASLKETFARVADIIL